MDPRSRKPFGPRKLSSKMKSILLFALLLLANACIATPQEGPPEANLQGIPFYQIYEENDIENTSKANFITTAPDGRLFFGSENGLHTFDGTKWKLVLKTPTTKEKIRCMIWTEQGVFAAGFGTIGKISFEDEKGLQYLPLIEGPLTQYSNEFYSKVHRIGNRLYFVGERSVATYDLETQKVDSASFDFWIKASAVFKGKLHIATTRVGIVVFEPGGQAVLPAFEKFVDRDAIRKIETSASGEAYFVTESNDIYRVPAGHELSDFVPFPFHPEGAIRDFEFIEENKLAISVAHVGIFFVDRDAHILYSLGKSTDYRWVASNQLHLDKHKTLWVQFNASIGKIVLDSPVSQIDERLSTGFEYPIAYEVEGQVIIRTKGNLLRPEFDEHGVLKGLVNPIPDFEKYIVTASASSEGLYFQGEKTTYLLADGKIQNLGKTGYIERMVTFENDPNKLFVATAENLVVLERRGQHLVTLSQTPHKAGHANKIAREHGDVFWIEIGLGQIGRATFENGEIKYQLFTQEDGLSSDWIAVWEHEGKVLLSSDEGITQYDPQTQRFASTDIIEEYLPAKGVFHRLATDPKGNIWASYNQNNYILWKQEDGKYIKDSASLARVGDQYFNQFKFLSNGDALLLTSSELFHVDGSRLGPPDDQQHSELSLFEVSDIEGSTIYYLNPGFESSPDRLEFSRPHRNLSFRFGDTLSSSIKAPQYQYILDGLSKDWSRWSTSNEVNVTKLDSGSYTLRVRSRTNNAAQPSEISVPFSIAPQLWETPIAFIAYFIAFSVLLKFGYTLFAAKLKKANEKLERMVNERTQEIESKNNELQQNATELTIALNELRSAQDLLMSASRKAGMAEVATNVLHNVGNVLNSINVSILSLSEQLKQERISKLVRIAQLINSHQNDLADFFTNNPKGKAIPDYLIQLSSVLKDDYSHYEIEVECMQENIEHVKKIITTQQSHAKTVEVLQSVKIEELFDDTLEMITDELEHSFFEIVRDFEPDLEIISDKHSLLQMITNFIKNSKESIIEAKKPLGLISLSAKTTSNKKNVRIQISDNGVGISQENRNKIFTHGFTTKVNGHGFGMHSCANAAKNLGGSLRIDSEGPGRGATVTLRLPLIPESIEKKKAKNRLAIDSPYSRN